MLMRAYGDANRIYNIEEKELRECSALREQDIQAILKSRKTWDAEKEYEKLERAGITFLLCAGEGYPERLRNIPSPPFAIYQKGKPFDESRLTVAIVGARKCTNYGETMARKIAGELADYGAIIVSGLARGIDGAAQRGALDHGGISHGVLGCGVDLCYPREHIGLYTDLQEQGSVLSELPPKSPPLPQHFPARNRIISGLSDVVLVIEAREKSGSLITADMALEQGKDVFALPGPVDSDLSRGCHALIRQGAGILTSVSDLLEDLGVEHCQFAEKNKFVLENAENLVYSCLDLYPKSLNQIVDETQLPAAELIKILISLELQGYIKELSKHYFVRVDDR